MASSAHFELTITRVDEPVFRGQALSVTVPGSEGALTLLAHHEPFISLLTAGTVVVKKGNTELEQYEISNGILEVSQNQVTILL